MTEASCIDLRLPIGTPVEEAPGCLGYYPEFARLSRNQRATYLKWLSDGRSGPLSDIGYVFLFFYGLERRLLVEKQDLSPIVKEVVRLLETYTISGSFDGYLSRFLAYTLARAGIGTLKEKWFEAVFERTRAQRDEQHMAVGLAWLFSQQRSLPAAWALRIARLDPRSPRSVVLERLPEQFGALFFKRYREQFGEGMLLKAAKRDREVTYRAASPSLGQDLGGGGNLEPVRVPHVMGIQSQFSPLVALWTGCIEELKPLSRVMAKGANVTTREAYDALPDDLRAETEHPDKLRWESIASEHVWEDGTVVVEVGVLAETQGITERPKLTAAQSKSIAETANAVGFVIEPDIRINGRLYAWGDSVVLFRPEETPSLPNDSRYIGAAVLLELGMFVAAADGKIEEDEVNHIAAFLESQFLLDPPDARRLEALKRVFLRQHPTLAGIGKRLQAVLNAHQLETVGQFLVGVASANGTIEKNEVTALRKAYKALGIELKSLDRALVEYNRRSKELVEVLPPADSQTTGEAIPVRESSVPQPAFHLDVAVLERLMRETRQVSILIGEAMTDEESDVRNGDEISVETLLPPAEPCFNGLDSRYGVVLAVLCTKTSWSWGEFDALVRRHLLMPSGTLEVINGWAFEQFDDPLLEHAGDDLIVHTGLLAESA
jgi:uncharacterized tellurite resistance protein B-like protein